MRPQADTERRTGSPRIEGKHRRRRRVDTEVWFGAEKVSEYQSSHKRAGHFWRGRGVAEGYAGCLSGYVWRELGTCSTPRRKVVVFLREEPPCGVFEWTRVLPSDVEAAVCGQGYRLALPEWTSLEV